MFPRAKIGAKRLLDKTNTGLYFECNSIVEIEI